MVDVVAESCFSGVGLRSEHYPYLESHRPKTIKWFEAVSENYMHSYGRPRQILDVIRRDFPVALHGVGLNLASCDEINTGYLHALKSLADDIDPFIISDHLCWTGATGHYSHNLLPFPLTRKTLHRLVCRLDQIQTYLKRCLYIENVSTYLTFKSSEYTEWEFLVELVTRAGTKLLLDLNNIYVNAVNHGFDPLLFLDHIPSQLIGQIHLAGYSDCGDFLFDTHSKPVWPEVWKLFAHVIKHNPQVPFMVEWDEAIPKFEVVAAEVDKARHLWHQCHGSKLS